MTRFGVMKHLRLLEAAGLVVAHRAGREELHHLDPAPIRRTGEPLQVAPAASRRITSTDMHDPAEDARERMVEEQIVARGVADPAVLAAMRAVPRHRFVPGVHLRVAYADHPLPIGHGVTISQPYIVALMTELAQIRPGDRVLEIGTGCAYQTAVLAALGAQVFSVEILDELAAQAAATLAALGLVDITLRRGDGHAGWPEHAPFAAIVVTAAPPVVPPPLLAQLAPGGRLVIPVGRGVQDLQRITRHGDTFSTEAVAPVRFVPMTGVVQND
jgi:protein-L-isoaspartate(D-aspartate) O-methyltransferase